MGKKAGIILSVVCVIAMVAGIGVQAYADKQVEEQVRVLAAELSSYADIGYQEVKANLLNSGVTLNDVSIKPVNASETIKIAQISMSNIAVYSEIPAQMDVLFTGISVNGLSSDSAQLISRLGYDSSLLANVGIGYEYNIEKKELSVKRLSFGADNAGQLELSFKLGSIAYDPKMPIAFLFNLPQVMLHAARVEYTDASLVDRFMKVEAQNSGMSLEDMKEMFAHNVEILLEQQSDEFTRQSIKVLADFIQNPTKLSITLSPEHPQTFARVMRSTQPGEIVRLLNIKIKS
ncbi:MAG: hypothetical protein RBR43_02160 [Desulfuromonadaceae bacterium]|nr:hypothetical protein [Desulfuromonas sp.]MDY0184669.1 hypothetical protein [Desulfuromonadaceae bacterium]